MKKIILILVSLIMTGSCSLKDNQNLRLLRKTSGLEIPDNVKDIKCQFVVLDEERYPYIFYSRFECDSQSYFIIQKQISLKNSSDEDYNNNMMLNGNLLVNDPKFLAQSSHIDWWDIADSVRADKIYLNYFDDTGEKKIGDSTKFNGKIASFFEKPYCYVFIECYSP